MLCEIRTQLTPSKKHSNPQFSVRVYCGQTAGWIKMPLGREVCLGPDDIMLDGEPVPRLPKRIAPSQFPAYVYCGQTVAHLGYC